MQLISKQKRGNKRIINILGFKISYKKNHTSILPVPVATFLYKVFAEASIRRKNSKKTQRFLEIGPGSQRLKGFEGLNIVKNNATDYIADVSKGIPFKSNTFNLIYSSHFLEHIEWYKTSFVLREIYRVLNWGVFELWIPDGLKIAEQFILAEKKILKQTPDGWLCFNPDDNPYLWANGRLFYGANPAYPSWHKAVFSENYLKQLLSEIGFKNISKMTNSQCRGYDHGWINLGIRAEKIKE